MRRLKLDHLFEPPRVYEDDELEYVASAPTLTHRLNRPIPADGRVQPTSREPWRERAGAERPGLYSHTHGWRLLGGPNRLPHVAERNEQERRICAWMELQYLWLRAFRACVDPTAPWAPLACVKLVTEVSRIWLWLAHGERVATRRELIDRALIRIPEEEESLRRALDLYRNLTRSPPAPLPEALASLVRMSNRIAERLSMELGEPGHTEVALSYERSAEFVVSPSSVAALSQWASQSGLLNWLPLADWRAVVWPFPPPDEIFAVVGGDPTDPVLVGRAAELGNDGAYPAMRAGSLLVIPSLKRARLRAIHCSLTDPVSFALVNGVQRARFPQVAGWSAEDTAGRAVAEHLGWLMATAGGESTPDALARLFSAARAGLFLESLGSAEPELLLTVAAVAERLAGEGPGTDGTADEALGSYRAARVEGAPPSSQLVSALRDRVMQLPAYRDS